MIGSSYGGGVGIARRTLAAGALALSFLPLSGCGVFKSYPTYRYRLTVEVDTPQGLRSGSSVIEVHTSEVRSSLGGHGAEIRGEAAAVDLPGGQTLFALLRSEASADWAKDAMMQVTPAPPDDGGPVEEAFARRDAAVLANKQLNVLPRKIATVFPADQWQSGYPMLVRFGDVHDPKSVARVDPDALEASFGPGVKLRRITVQLTDDPRTTGIGKRLNDAFWSRWGQIHNAEMQNGPVNGNPYFDSLAGQLSKNDFVEQGI